MIKICAAAAIAACAWLFEDVSAAAVEIPSASLNLAGDVTMAAGYEKPPAEYIVANGTQIFANHFYYGSKVTGELKRGERIEGLAKVKGYDWLLVGRNGVGIGYVPISMLAPAELYVP
jgi:hypothetical protein